MCEVSRSTRSKSERQCDVVFYFLEDDVGPHVADAGDLEHEIVEESVVGRHVADDDPQVKVGIARRRKAFEYLRPPSNTRNELRDEFLVVAVERELEECPHRKSGL